ncbi:hypothetical protein SARC_06047 [Sphaeroforma arctica JP610]|uniref:rRNA-processing protein EFG1 n=1 Tax=Sphaeroforma arctica JP610 TaxID=667725 RepID=A0A0L0FXV2_9EUKA|nr:hypothetical protein SARC_06047 [Sphaeroforma arctica JP610]KNC81642.1 hypothetical protein SARC_06047 [Sphaeroforma arctica JP610]|eukprot:XP_014155544.1 hypothetical protein SARC_06047 [Sphaeroforma arctica JP610]
MPKGKKFNEERGNGSSKSVKARIRDIRRLLKRDDLVATVRVEKERMLEMLESDLKEKQNQELEKKLTEKYKMVKFFGMFILHQRVYVVQYPANGFVDEATVSYNLHVVYKIDRLPLRINGFGHNLI